MCDKNITVNLKNNYSFWENKDTTKDEKEIINYLKNNLQIIRNKKILHIGIGNSELGLTFCKESAYIDGLTISVLEKNKGLNYNCYRNIHICNKYNLNDINKFLTDHYDIIIDQGIKCYTCCQNHFDDLFDFYIKKINKKGLLISSIYGMNWSGYDISTKIKNNQFKKKKHKDKTNFEKKGIFTDNELYEKINRYNLSPEKHNNVLLLKIN